MNSRQRVLGVRRVDRRCVDSEIGCYDSQRKCLLRKHRRCARKFTFAEVVSSAAGRVVDLQWFPSVLS